jgi:hypothetical protein
VPGCFGPRHGVGENDGSIKTVVADVDWAIDHANDEYEAVDVAKSETEQAARESTIASIKPRQDELKTIEDELNGWGGPNKLNDFISGARQFFKHLAWPGGNVSLNRGRALPQIPAPPGNTWLVGKQCVKPF